MTKAKTVEMRKAILRARGVPERFVDALATRKDVTVRALVALAITILFLFGGLAAVMLDVLDVGTRILRFLTVLFHADAGPALLYLGNSTIGAIAVLVLLLSVGIAMASVFTALVSHDRPWPSYNTHASLLRSLQTPETLEALKPNPALQALADLPDEMAFLKAIRSPSLPLGAFIGLFGSFVLIFGVVTVPMLIESFDYNTVTLNRIVVHDIKGAQTYRLADARYAYVLCYDKMPGGFDYRVAFANRTVDLWGWSDDVHKLRPREVLGRLETIDHRLAALGVAVHRMPVDQGHECVADMARRLKTDDKRLLNRLVFGG